jgi:NADH pyrophosphatase NudC (nudix superfamily)
MENHIEDFVEKMNIDLLENGKVDVRKKMENFEQYKNYYKETKFELPFNGKSLIKFKYGTLYFCSNCGLIPPF